MASSLCAAAALLATIVGVRETLPREARVRFRLRRSNPLGFVRLFRKGRTLCLLATILALQARATQNSARNSRLRAILGARISRRAICRRSAPSAQGLHDGEGDMWQVFSADVRGWGVAQNAKYGAAIGVATTVGGLITGRSVRLLGNRLHTLAWTLSTALSNLMFMSPSTRVAMGSVVFAGAEDCMQAAANARLVQAGSALGMRKGQLAADYGNLLACVRVAGLYLFGKLCAVGMKAGVPQLPYVICMGLQLLAAALIFLIPSTEWLDSGGPEDDADE